MKTNISKKPTFWHWQEKELQTIACPVCGYKEHRIIYTRPDYLHIVQCQNCQFRFVQPQPSQNELNRFYQEGYFSGNHDFHQGQNYFQSRKEAITSECVTGWQFLKSHVDLSQKRILDLGCADGALLVLAKQNGATKVAGIEVNSDAAAYGRKEYGLEICQTSAESLPYASETFDVVTAFDLIEHVRQPKQLFKEVNRVLSKAGLFVGGCPDMGCFDDWGKDWIGVQRNMEHLSYFDEQSLLKLATESGFKLISLQYQGFPLSLKAYKSIESFKGLPLVNKALQPNVWLFNVWQKIRVKQAQSKHGHELLFILQKK